MTIPGWTRFYAQRHDENKFAADMARLRALGGQILGDAARGVPAWQHDTIWTQLRHDMSSEARKAVFSGWPTTSAHFRILWDAA